MSESGESEDDYGKLKDDTGQTYRELREILARNKDFSTSILKPDLTCPGEVIPVSGDGNLTNDRDMET